MLAATDSLVSEGGLIRLADFTLQLSAPQQVASQALLARFAASPFNPPSVTEAQQDVGVDVFHALIELGELKSLQTDVVMTPAAYRAMASGALSLIDADGVVSVRSLRDKFQSSRKFAIALLEHLDSLGITRRAGDDRVRGSAALPAEFTE
jgi:selenocysteine-specific elongation factor